MPQELQRLLPPGADGLQARRARPRAKGRTVRRKEGYGQLHQQHQWIENDQRGEVKVPRLHADHQDLVEGTFRRD